MLIKLLNLVSILSILFAQLSICFAQSTKKDSISAAKLTQSNQLTIVEIAVEGNRKIEKDAILARITSKVGEAYSAEIISADVENLFKSGFFNDVEVYRTVGASGVTLLFKVLEKPSIVEIQYNGNSEVKDEDLAEATGLKAFEIVSMSKIREAQEKLQKLYEDKGFFLAKIDVRVEELKKDETAKLVFDIQENDKVKVKKVKFLGNVNLKDGVLKSKMATQEGGFFSFMSGSGAYKQDAFDRDMQILRYLYYNEGYIQVKIDRPQVYVSPDKKGIFITIRIEEGNRYNVGDVDFSGDLLFTKDELRNTIKIDKAGIFAYETMQKDLADLQAKYGDLGYAFANVIPRTRIDDKEKKVDITFEFDKGNKVYFGKINIIGNNRTRDKVIRREIKVLEGELYNETNKRLSIERVQRLGFFDEVNFKTAVSPENPDLLNIDVVVKERHTGSVMLGAGYGSATGGSFNGRISESNFLGKGQYLSASLESGQTGTTFNIGFTEPHLYDSQWSAGFDLYQSVGYRSDYDEKDLGGGLRFGHPIQEDLNWYLRYKLVRTNYFPRKDKNDVDLTDRQLFPLEDATGKTSSVTATIEFDQRNDRFSPSKGIFASASAEYAGIGGDTRFTKSIGTFRYFKKIFWDVVWRNNLTYGVITYPADETVPFSELFLLGGPYSLRGYQSLSVGRRVFSQKAYDYNQTQFSKEVAEIRARKAYGGKQQLYYSTELEFPLIPEAGIKGVTFYDIGQAEDTLKGENFFADVGFGFRWFSPLGPLRFEWGFPLNREPDYHLPSNFEFSIGSPF